ncbi:hypothetical protein WCD74_22900 [Actinomycetospora sp. OC33-EN08]|uniref:Uncharacterized protein n=1 Tax=Actinomycetospora aurantiaca TaxID=3129233 RepID=A0ABU8MUG5_9PSEU
MSSSTDTRIVFTAGRYNPGRTEWQDASNAPTASIEERLFRSIFDAVGERTIDTTGDIDPGVLLRLVELGPHGREKTTARLRLVCRSARRRGMRVGFAVEAFDVACFGRQRERGATPGRTGVGPGGEGRDVRLGAPTFPR